MNNRIARCILIAMIIANIALAPQNAHATHPQVLVNPADREAVTYKIAHSPWAATAYDKVKARVDQYVDRCQADPHWMSSRLCMNWQTHYTLPVTRKQRWVGGEGHAPVPTPRFAGARDWATKYGAPADLADVKPYNDQDGKIWLVNSDTHQGEWVDPGITGRTIESINERIIQSAADAGFIYWLTGDEKYAKYASEILWTYMDGFSYVQSPQYPADDKGTADIIGMTSFEVIHENVMLPICESYDFLYDYLKKQGKDVGVIQTQIKRMTDRVIAGGFADGNWNLNQAMMIAYGALALEDNSQYPGGHGRQYYIDLVLNTDTPTQRGIARVIHKGYDQQTALWPEAPGYGFGATWLIVQVASLMSADPAGQSVLKDPFLTKALLAQMELIYPNGFSIGLGDTDNTRLNAGALELLLASARKNGDAATETRLTSALQREIVSGNYIRESQDNIFALTHFVGDLKDAPPAGQDQDRTYWAPALNILMQRTAGDSDHALAAAMYGTNGGHVHANGLAMELYGAGLIQGADPGRGASYWTADHGEYYSQPPAHNTVIVNGKSSYPMYGADHIAMELQQMEPQPGRKGISTDISYAQTSFHYAKPAADQQRTLAVVRTGPKTGFYFDVFRSRADQEAGSFHDYIYHNIGQSLTLADPAGKPLALESSNQLTSAADVLKGYDYFKDEKSINAPFGFHGTFTTDMPDGTKHLMDVWMLGEPDRRLFAVEAPADHAARPSLPASFQKIGTPAFIARQNGEAWKRPFVAVYEPYLGSEGSRVQSVRAARMSDGDNGLVACVVESHVFDTGARNTTMLLQDTDGAQHHDVEGCVFQGSFGVVTWRDGIVSELYLGHGKSVGKAGVSLTSAMDTDADFSRQGDMWRFSASNPVRATIDFSVPEGDANASHWTLIREDNHGTHPIDGARIHVDKSPSGRPVLAVTCDLTPGHDAVLSLVKRDPHSAKNGKTAYDFAPVTAQIQQWVDKGYYPGASLIVYKDKHLIYEHCFGNYDTNTVAFIASAGKWLAAATIAAVVDGGKLSWDDPVSKWLPEFKDAKGHATLRQLLSHTSGYPDYQPAGNPVDNYQTLAESVAHIAPLPIDTDPGTHFHYGGLAMQVAGRMAELAAGKDWETLFQDKIAKPLHMTGTHFTPVDSGGGHSPMLGGGARANLYDYANFLSMISSDGMFEGKRIFSRRVIQEMQADQVQNAAVEPGAEYVEHARGETYTGIYGLGEWRERLDSKGQAVLISSPSWAGAYPWIDKTRGVYGFFLTHVDTAGPAGKDHFNSFLASPVLAILVGASIDRAL